MDSHDCPLLFISFERVECGNVWNRFWFTLLLDEPPYMAIIFDKNAVFRGRLVRSSFADPSLLVRSTLLVGALLYLGGRIFALLALLHPGSLPIRTPQ